MRFHRPLGRRWLPTRSRDLSSFYTRLLWRGPLPPRRQALQAHEARGRNGAWNCWRAHPRWEV